jgi:hypothetical protein
MICAYCNTNPSDESEHVFPFGLGGENKFLNCVCKECNGKFSEMEGELLQKSIIGLMRNEVGLEGYRKDRDHPASLKKATLLFQDETSGVVYDVGQSAGFMPYMRPQMIEIAGAFYLEGSSDKDLKRFSKLFVKWSTNNLMLVELPFKGISPNAVKFKKVNEEYTTENVTVDEARGAILLKQISPEHKLYNELTQRLFLDDEGKLFLRSRSIKEGTKFIKRLLSLIETRTSFNSFQKKTFTSTPTINVSFKFDQKMVERALVKIGLNTLFQHYPDSRYNKELDAAKQFVRFGNNEFESFFGTKLDNIDLIEDSHSISFIQYDESLLIRINLFSGQFIFAFFIKGMFVMKVSEHAALDINYVKRRQVFMNINELLADRAQRLIKRNPLA